MVTSPTTPIAPGHASDLGGRKAHQLDVDKLVPLKELIDRTRPDPRLPPRLTGRIVAADGSTPLAGVGVEVAFDRATGRGGGRLARGGTGADGRFVLTVAWGDVPWVAGYRLVYRRGVHAGEQGLDVKALVESGGDLGTIVAPAGFSAEAGIGERLGDLLEGIGSVLEPAESATAPAGDGQPRVQVGEGQGSYALSWTGGAIDRFGYSILYRLIEPALTGGARHALTRPLDVFDFRDRLESRPKELARIGTLGIGYLVRLHQQWQPSHLSLGDLLYSLPLAPGEEQRVAVFDRRESLSVADRESMTVTEEQQYGQAQDTSASAVFHAALAEQAQGHTHAETESHSAGFGTSTGAVGEYQALMFGTVAAGVGSSWNKGDISIEQAASRNFDSRASEDFHDRLARQATGRRQAARVGIRLASASESAQVTTKVIANHNHSHALTMQYWEVLRNYRVTTRIDDVQLVCYVPMELVAFLPAGQKAVLTPSQLGALMPDDVLRRYEVMIRCHDVLLPWLPPLHADGLRTLKQFASYPAWETQRFTVAPTGLREVIEVRGAFLACDRIEASLLLRNGRRFGPVALDFTPVPLREDCSTRDELLQAVAEARGEPANTTLATGSIQLPEDVVDDDLAALEVAHRMVPLTYRLVPSPHLPAALADLQHWADRLPGLLEALNQPIVTLSAAAMRQRVGGPHVAEVRLRREDQSVESQLHASPRAVLEGARRWPTTDHRPTLGFRQLQRIEAAFQHVVANTALYSRATWLSLTAEERALMLEACTLGVPAGLGADAGAELPLLNCVSNQIVGFFGNAMIMPFAIPPTLAASLGFTTREVQEALLRFHREGFRPSESTISLPTRGMLGEAVLGASNASEKIDLTRFWNWQDSPAEHAADISPADLSKASMLAGAAQAPDSLLTHAPANVITLNNGAGTALPDLLSKIVTVPGGTGFDVTGQKALESLLGKSTDVAAEARRNVVDASEKLAEKALDTYAAMKGGAGAAKGGAAGSGSAGAASKGGDGAGAKGADSGAASGAAAGAESGAASGASSGPAGPGAAEPGSKEGAADGASGTGASPASGRATGGATNSASGRASTLASAPAGSLEAMLVGSAGQVGGQPSISEVIKRLRIDEYEVAYVLSAAAHGRARGNAAEGQAYATRIDRFLKLTGQRLRQEGGLDFDPLQVVRFDTAEQLLQCRVPVKSDTGRWRNTMLVTHADVDEQTEPRIFLGEWFTASQLDGFRTTREPGELKAFQAQFRSAGALVLLACDVGARGAALGLAVRRLFGLHGLLQMPTVYVNFDVATGEMGTWVEPGVDGALRRLEKDEWLVVQGDA